MTTVLVGSIVLRRVIHRKPCRMSIGRTSSRMVSVVVVVVVMAFTFPGGDEPGGGGGSSGGAGGGGLDPGVLVHRCHVQLGLDSVSQRCVQQPDAGVLVDASRLQREG